MIDTDIFRCVQTVESGELQSGAHGKIEFRILNPVVQREPVGMRYKFIGVTEQTVELFIAFAMNRQNHRYC